MALSKPVGAAASIAGVLAGLATVVGALSDADTSACIVRVASALGPHASTIGIAAVGLIAGVAPAIAWFSHAPVPLSPKQQADDIIRHDP